MITGIICIDDDQSALIGTLACSLTQEQSCRASRLLAAGIDPETLETVRHDVERARKVPYLDYLRALMPEQRREAIFDLADAAWGTEVPLRPGSSSNPLFLNHPN